MRQHPFHAFFERFGPILGEGALIERLRRLPTIDLDPHLVNSAFIYDAPKRAAIETLYRQYLDIGRRYDLPMILSTPTWRASRERIAAAGLEAQEVNGDNVRFLDAIRKDYGNYAAKVAIGGLISCRGDAYDPTEALSAETAQRFHDWQAHKLAAAGVDFLLAATLPALSEAIGLSAALASTDVPYLISFVARPEGTLLDGTPLKTAIATIDAAVRPEPLAYLINCTHASLFKAALAHPSNSSDRVRDRVCGLLANTAALAPEALDNSEQLVEEAPERFGRTLADLTQQAGIKILGGCCGTDDRHIHALARRLVNPAAHRPPQGK